MTFFRGTSIHPGFIGGMRRRIKEKSDYQYHCRRIADRLFDDRIGETGADESGKPQQPQQTIQKLILAYPGHEAIAITKTQPNAKEILLSVTGEDR